MLDQNMLRVAIADKRLRLNAAVVIRIGTFGNAEAKAVPNIRQRIVDGKEELFAEISDQGSLMMVYPETIIDGAFIFVVFWRDDITTKEWTRSTVRVPLDPMTASKLANPSGMLDEIQRLHEAGLLDRSLSAENTTN